jgi:hypothetical protein
MGPLGLTGTNTPHLAQIAFVLLTIDILYNLLKKWLIHRSRAAFKAANGNAQSAPLYPQWDHVFGLDQFRASLAAFREHRMLAYSQQRFRTVSTTTFSHYVLGRKTIMTLEPANLKVIQALEHRKWGLGGRRKRAFEPLLGPGEWFFFFGIGVFFEVILVVFFWRRLAISPLLLAVLLGDLVATPTPAEHQLTSIPSPRHIHQRWLRLGALARNAAPQLRPQPNRRRGDL